MQAEQVRRGPKNTASLYVAALFYQYSGEIQRELLAREALAQASPDR